MDFRTAVNAAKEYIRQLYATEAAISDLALEELEHEAATDVWSVTIGFNLAREDAIPDPSPLPTLPSLFYGNRKFKVVRMSGDGSFLSVKDPILWRAQ